MSDWHLEKKVGISHVISTLLLAGAIFAWAGNADKRLALLDQNDKRQDVTIERQQQDIKEQLALIVYKIDKIIDRDLESR